MLQLGDDISYNVHKATRDGWKEAHRQGNTSNAKSRSVFSIGGLQNRIRWDMFYVLLQ